MMAWWQNIPFFTILLCLLSGAICSVLPAKAARAWVSAVLGVCFTGGILLLAFLRPGKEASFVYMMGHFPAPWGNEIRCGQLEAYLACLFPFVMGCALLGGRDALRYPEKGVRESLYLALCMLLMAALLSQVYSNDLFTCYVFLEVMTLSACALIILRDHFPSLVAGLRYMVLNLVGSGLFLLGVVLLYDLTGHLLMENLRQAIAPLSASGEYQRSLTIIIGLITTGLCVKSALFPFHAWVPEAYSASLPSSNAILSSLVSKGYIILLLKCYTRVFGWDLVQACRVDHLLMLFSFAGVIVGSLEALRARRFSRMIAWSSVAQIGYIYLGLSLGADAGYQAALFHLSVHAVSKSLLFLSGDALRRQVGGSDWFPDLRGTARRQPLAGVCWTVAAFSMVGLPFTGGLVSKLLLGEAALSHSPPIAVATLLVLALSTFLNVCYFLRTVLLLWSPFDRLGVPAPLRRTSSPALAACGALALAIFASFVLAHSLAGLLSDGLIQFQ